MFRLVALLALAFALLPAAPAQADCKGVNSLGVGAREVDAGDTLPHIWELCAADGRDWVGLFEPGAPNATPLAYRFTGGELAPTSAVPFYVPTTIPEGPYELRLIAGKTTLRLAQSPGFWVHGQAVTQVGSLSHVWASLPLGSYQTFSWTVAPAHGADRINLYQYGGSLAQTCYANAQRQGQMDCYLDPATMAPGIYVGCLFSGWNGAQLACDSTFAVTP